MRSTILLLLLLFSGVNALPPGFIDQEVASGLGTDLTGFSVVPEGADKFTTELLVTKRTGPLFLLTIKDNAAVTGHTTPTVTVKQIANFNGVICMNGGRGLLNAIFHPNYKVNNYIYISYSYMGNSACADSLTTGPYTRMSRFIYKDGMVDRSSEKIFFQSARNEKSAHSGGNMLFGKDGYLYIALGDAGSKAAGLNLGDLKASLLRFTMDGDVPLDNPYASSSKSVRCNVHGVPPPGSPSGSICQEIFAKGLRNPFKIAQDPNVAHVKIYMMDVGDIYYEEISEGGTHFAGANYGWNKREGPCDEVDKNCAADPTYRDPVYWYAHPTSAASKGGAVVGGAFPIKGKWPSEYDDVFFYGDYVYGNMYMLIPNAAVGCRTCSRPRAPFSNRTFIQSPEIIDMRFSTYRGTGQTLYYLNRMGPVLLRRVVFTGGMNRAPTAAVNASTSVGRAGIPIVFDGLLSSDPDGDALSYLWNFGDGGTTSTKAQPSHVYTRNGSYEVSLTVMDGKGGVHRTVYVVQIGTPPTVSIVSPAPGTKFAVGDVLVVNGQATDSNGHALDAMALTWEVRQHHGTHFHPFFAESGNGLALPPAPEPEGFLAATNSYLEILVTATDADGLSTTVSLDVMPKTAYIEFDTEPSGLDLILDTLVITTPQRLLSWEQDEYTVDGPSTSGYKFVSWSDGGLQQHNILVSGNETNRRLVATFLEQRDALPWVEDFESQKVGAISDSAPTSWSASRSSGTFSVTDKHLRLNGAGPEGVFKSGLIACEANSNLLVSVDVTSIGQLEPSDYAKLIVVVDNGSELILSQTTGNTAQRKLYGTVVASKSIVVMIRGLVSSTTENYVFDNLRVDFSTAAPIAPPTLRPVSPPRPVVVPSPILRPTSSPAISPVSSVCQVPWQRPDLTIGAKEVNDVQQIDTSCVSKIVLSVNLSHKGTLEHTGSGVDFLKIFYKVDDQPETLWLDIKGQTYISPSTISVAAGRKLSIRTAGDTSSSSEAYLVRALRVSA